MKRELNAEKLSMAAEMMKAIAHPLRISIINALEEKGEMTVTALYQYLDIEQSAASQHLRIMKDRQVVEAIRKGKNIYYRLKHAAIGNILECIEKCQSKL